VPKIPIPKIKAKVLFIKVSSVKSVKSVVLVFVYFLSDTRENDKTSARAHVFLFFDDDCMAAALHNEYIILHKTILLNANHGPGGGEEGVSTRLSTFWAPVAPILCCRRQRRVGVVVGGGGGGLTYCWLHNVEVSLHSALVVLYIPELGSPEASV
jgi:hypothetical protein